LEEIDCCFEFLGREFRLQRERKGGVNESGKGKKRESFTSASKKNEEVKQNKPSSFNYP